ncbi:hypothetical protein ACLB1G_21705 [Oxalobacteraceae bacterium A2-2]
MGASEQHVSPYLLERAEAFKHDQALLRAAHKALQVVYREKFCFIHSFYVDASSTEVVTMVYLRGSPVAVPACELTLAPQIT